MWLLLRRCRRHLFLSQSVPRRRTFWALPTASTKNNCAHCYCSRHVCTLLHYCHFLPPFPFSHQSVFFRGEKWNRGPSWRRKTILSIRSGHIWTQQQPLLILQASTTPDDSDDSLDSFLQGRRSSLSVVEESSLRRTISFWCLASCYSSMAYPGATWRQVSVKGSWLDAWTPCAPLIQCYSISSGSMRRQKLLSDSFRFVSFRFVLFCVTKPGHTRPGHTWPGPCFFETQDLAFHELQCRGCCRWCLVVSWAILQTDGATAMTAMRFGNC